MSIATELQNYADGLDDSYDAVNDMGGIIPAHKNMDNLDQAIRTIPQSGGATYTAGYGINIDANNEISVDTTDIAEVSDIPTNTSDLVNDGSDGTSTYVEADDLATVATSGLYSDLTGTPSLATVATSGDYDDLLNKPTIPAAQVNSDWNANSGVAEILNKPTIPTVNDATLTITQNGTTAGTFSANASSAATIALTDTTYSDMVGATSLDAGTHGLVPAPSAGDESKVLSGAGTWVAQTAAQVNSDWNSNSGVSQILNKPTILTPLDIYPVGAIYMSVNNTDPGTLFGGTWTQITDRFILAAGSTYSGGTTGGAATINLSHSHTVDSHNHSLPSNTGSTTLTIDQIPAHTHAVAYQWNTGTGTARCGVSDNFGTSTPSGSTGGGKGHSHTIGGNTGSKSPGTNSQLSSTQSILPPYLAVYVWKRTA